VKAVWQSSAPAAAASVSRKHKEVERLTSTMSTGSCGAWSHVQEISRDVIVSM